MVKTQICSKCKEEKPSEAFHPYNHPRKKRQAYCISCVNAYYREHRKEYLAKACKKRKERRRICIEHYGGKCACCGEITDEFLSIDHINGDGHKHRKQINRASVYYWLIKNDFPEGFRILCHNCNQAMGIYGYCPHQKMKG